MKSILITALTICIALTACSSGGGSDSNSAPSTYSISGTVTLSPIGLQGVTMTLNSSATVTTDSNGNYSFTGLANGSYTVTPGKTGYTFDPVSIAVTLSSADSPSNNFTATAPPTTSSNSISGTAAKGSPIANATITLKDAAGRSASATTNSDGSYTIDVTGLYTPFLLLVSTTTGSIYSVSADANANTVVNITPLTDLIIRSWYEVQGDSVDTAFADPATYPAPSPMEVQVIVNVVKNMMQLWLNQAGVTADNFNLISTPFSADGSGVDKVLDQTSVDTATGAVLVSDGTTTQNSTFSIAALSSSVTVSTTTTNAIGSSSSTISTVVPTASAEEAALSGINAMLTDLANTIQTKGSSLVAGDLLPYLDPALLDGGDNQAHVAADMAGRLSGMTVSFTVLQINSLDTTNNEANVLLRMSGPSDSGTVEWYFKLVNNKWLISGDQRVGRLNLNAEMRTRQGFSAGSGSGPNIHAGVDVPQGTVMGGVITGGGIWTNTALTQGYTIVEPSGNMDTFEINTGTLSQLPPAGTPFTFSLATASTGTVSYTVKTNAWTTEAISITNLTGTALAAANLGSSLTVNWTLPTTFTIARVRLGANVNAGGYQCKTTDSDTNRGITATTGTITMPATCNGLAASDVDVQVEVRGVNGERTSVIYGFKN